MSDETLRALQQRWRATRARDDETRYLQARVRSGELSRGRLELAAWLGHAPARAALGDDAPAGSYVDEAALGSVLNVPGRAAIIEACLADFVGQPEFDEPRVRQVLAALRAWCADPSAVQVAVLRQTAAPLARFKDERIMAADFETAAQVRSLEDHVRAVLGETVEPGRWMSLIRSLSGVEPLLAWALGPGHVLDVDSRDEVEVENQHLLARVKRGALDPDRLALAAYSGHAPAQRALGRDAPIAPVELIAWLEGLGRWGAPVQLGAAVDVCWHVKILFAPNPTTRAVEAVIRGRPAGPLLNQLVLEGIAALRQRRQAPMFRSLDARHERAERLLNAVLTSDVGAVLRLIGPLAADAASSALARAQRAVIERALAPGPTPDASA